MLKLTKAVATTVLFFILVVLLVRAAIGLFSTATDGVNQQADQAQAMVDAAYTQAGMRALAGYNPTNAGNR